MWMQWKQELFSYGSLCILPYQLLCLSIVQARRLISYLIHYADCKSNYIGDLRRAEVCGNSANSAHLNKLTHSSQVHPFFSLKRKYFDLFEVIQSSAATAESHFGNTWLDQGHLVGMCAKAEVPSPQEHLSTVFKCSIPVSQHAGDGQILNVIFVPLCEGESIWRVIWKQKQYNMFTKVPSTRFLVKMYGQWY